MISACRYLVCATGPVLNGFWSPRVLILETLACFRSIAQDANQPIHIECPSLNIDFWSKNFWKLVGAWQKPVRFLEGICTGTNKAPRSWHWLLFHNWIPCPTCFDRRRDFFRRHSECIIILLFSGKIYILKFLIFFSLNCSATMHLPVANNHK